eukprot:TRINITY_DN17087_c0_g1_i2.p1 TRINITY_DN17087_c0_g1~~TRINITY_DN17087_c0_g1_i2.p1  ORF type:complete len:316 (+),score=57.23 TRINITY_DN17087_c0_g1_i2:42-989(+)
MSVLLLLVLWCVVPAGSAGTASSYSTLFGARKTAQRDETVGQLTDFLATVNSLIEGMLWLDVREESTENILSDATQKLMKNLGSRGNRDDSMPSASHAEKECKVSVDLAEHNSHSTRHTEVKKPNATVGARRTASVQQSSTSDDTEQQSGDLTDDQRKAYEKMREELGADTRVVRTFCLNGLKAYPNATFDCESQPGATVTTAEWVTMPRSEQEKCTVSSSDVVCICPRDISPSTVDNVTACDTPVPMHCSVNVVEPASTNCTAYEHNLDWLEPCHWFSTKDVMRVRVSFSSSPFFFGALSPVIPTIPTKNKHLW